MRASFRSMIMVKIVALFIFGIFFGRFLGLSLQMVCLLAACLNVGLIAINFFVKDRSLTLSAALSINVLLLGWINILAQEEYSQNQLPKEWTEPTHCDVLVVIQDFVQKSNRAKVNAHLLSWDCTTTVSQCNVILDLWCSDLGDKLMPLDTLFVKNAQLTPSSLLPQYSNFDYRQYLLDQRIYIQISHLDQYLIKPIQNYQTMNWIRFKWRKKAIDKLHAHLEEKNVALASSLILGYRYELDSEIKKQFANTGAIHVLAVSGLHVGIIVGFLLLILTQNWKLKKQLKKKHVLVMLTVLGFYNLITGAAIPVVRSV